MKQRNWRRVGVPAGWLAVGICASLSLLGWFGYRATRDFQRSSTLLEQRRADEAARLIATALTRDMHGAQSEVLSSSTWDDFGFDSSHEVLTLVASAFARYPYPEAFFSWHADQPTGRATFYTRADRPPPWAPPPDAGNRYPVRVLSHPGMAHDMLVSIQPDISIGRVIAVAERQIGGDTYQIVALLKYRDRLRLELTSVRGFMVNLAWTRQHYFAELLRQVAQIGGEDPGLVIGIVDERGQPVAGDMPRERRVVSRRGFPLLFFDSVLMASNPRPHVSESQWTVLTTAVAEGTVSGFFGLELTLALATFGGVALAIGLGATARAMRTHAELSEMRAEFMASVTHELKTPIASIQAMGNTLSRGRLRDATAQREYAAVVTQEAKRLGRLVDNVLAYSRLTDVADVYSFEPLDIDDLVEASLSRFNPQIQSRCSISVDIPDDVPSIQADRAAMELMLDNLIDNAIRHSRARHIRIGVDQRAQEVVLIIADDGIGIERKDLGRITQKFVRGRTATAGGSGLGLTIVARIVTDHRGRFSIDSVPGTGTTVTVFLRAADGMQNRRAEAAAL
jgi:signal transduction histidine kinase